MIAADQQIDMHKTALMPQQKEQESRMRQKMRLMWQQQMRQMQH
jgi:hypothetical protein